MHITKALPQDLDRIMQLIHHSRTIMREHGNTVQWINGYPDRAQMQRDIEEAALYVMIKDQIIRGVFYFSTRSDPFYENILGAWPNELPYGVIHRLATDGQCKGIAKTAIDWCFTQINTLRIDTHENNHIMQAILKKENFEHCGTIFVRDDSPRMAFHKTLQTTK